MRVLAIAFKDLKQFARDLPNLILSLAAPLVLTAIIGFAFSGLGGSPPKLQVTTLQVANLDRGTASPPLNLGESLISALQGPGLQDLVQLGSADGEASARAAVKSRQAEMALIIPPGLSEALSAAGGRAEVVLYHDPALVTRPAIVAGAVQRVLDSFSGANIAAQVTAEQLSGRGAPAEAIQTGAARAAEAYAHESEAIPPLTVQADVKAPANQVDMSNVLARVNAAMMIFFMFYAAGIKAQSIIKEDEERTLARLFITPASRSTILAGKCAAVFLVTLVQAVLLMLASAFLFGVRWGNPIGAAAQTIGTVAAASGVGLLLMSFARSTRQAGFLLGILPVFGIAGGLFSAGFSNLPPWYDTVTLLTPHGWAMKGWTELLQGAGASPAPAAVCVAIGIVAFAAGVLVFRRRFAMAA